MNMSDNLFEDVKRAVKESQEARNMFTEAMYETSEKLGYTEPNHRNIKEKPIFGLPASEDRIAELERELNIKLPASYRVFLMLNNGWKVIDGSQSFFSIKELMGWRSRKDPSSWIAIAKDKGDEFVEDCLVIGASYDSPDKYLLNPKQIRDAEWQFIEYSKDGFVKYDSFLDYLIATKQQFIESAKGVDFGEYFDPFEEN